MSDHSMIWHLKDSGNFETLNGAADWGNTPKSEKISLHCIIEWVQLRSERSNCSTPTTSKCLEKRRKIGRGLTLAIVPSTEYPVIITPFFASGAHNSSNSRLGPLLMNPGDARITHGPASAIFRSHPRVAGRWDICLVTRLVRIERKKPLYLLEDKWIVFPRKPRSNVRVHGMDVGLVHRHALPRQIRRIVHRDTMQFRMRGPVFIQNQ